MCYTVVSFVICRELEEDESHNAMLYDAFGIEADTSPGQ